MSSDRPNLQGIVQRFCIASEDTRQGIDRGPSQLANSICSKALSTYRRLVAGLRQLWPDTRELRVSKSAISQARHRLGAQPLVSLFRRVCQPLATPDTPEAFIFGLRLMAVDCTNPATRRSSPVFTGGLDYESC
jgi:hypothetical protein